MAAFLWIQALRYKMFVLFYSQLLVNFELTHYST